MMKKLLNFAAIFALSCICIISCKKEGQSSKEEIPKEVPQSVIDKIHHLGFSTTNITASQNGYMVKGDILITKEQIEATPATQFLRVGKRSNTILLIWLLGFPEQLP